MLKKDVDHVINEILDDCFSYMELYPEKDHKPVEEIAEKALTLQDDMLVKINTKTTEKTAKENRAHFNSIKKEFMNEAEKLFTEVDKIIDSTEQKE